MPSEIYRQLQARVQAVRAASSTQASRPTRARTNAGVKKTGKRSTSTGATKPKPKPKPKPKSKRRAKKRKKKSRHHSLGSMDSILADPCPDPLARQDRWIPPLGQRPQRVSPPPPEQVAPGLWAAYAALDDWMYGEAHSGDAAAAALARGARAPPSRRPVGVDGTLWNIYWLLEAWVYRAGLTAEEAVGLPTFDEIMKFQDGGGPRPVTPPGWRWDGLDLEPVAAEGDEKEEP
ncbi:hypothetical protein JX265_002916 [Neoarthrinium moseri]|uniref:Uncharacterized protein n=1 Tax=Neoarthrinium moseri TaxID=1658444 RepID=A0A9P9WT97_9PEZI|nr:hypothetical protein JX265_002916 [Neoarthrinium moseri]